MARKANRPKNGLNHNSSNKKGIPRSECGSPLGVGSGKINDVKAGAHELSCDEQANGPLMENIQGITSGDGTKKNKKSMKFEKSGDEGMDTMHCLYQSMGDNSEVVEDVVSMLNEMTFDGSHDRESSNQIFESASNGSKENVIRIVHFSHLPLQSAWACAFSIGKIISSWVERHQPFFDGIARCMQRGRDHIYMRFLEIYPIVIRWLVHVGNITLILSIIWLDSALRGMGSILHAGTTTFFVVLWSSILSLVMMIGMAKCFLVLAVTALIGFFVSLIAALLAVAASGAVILWLYGSFWLTSLAIGFGGLAFAFSHERLALLVTTMYSVYSAWIYAGWCGILLAMNLSFISSDVLIYFLKSKIDESRSTASAQTAGMQDQQYFTDSESHNSYVESDSRSSADRGAGVASTSGTDSEVSSEDEVIRLLNCTDHYTALGFSRYEHIDISILKREYRKKAMLVHPDKNMGNDKAAEAFKKLQNAYEVLLDSLKRKAYDDELRREELLNYFRRFQSTSQQNRMHSFFGNGFARSEAGNDDPGESRRIACKKCGSFHIWFQTKRSKTQARWCQDCKDFHQAKDGDGWVEQSSKPFLFGILQKVDAPTAYVCADGRIYDATEWYICQGMRCAANTHKPTFQVNTSVTKHYHGKGNSPHRGGIPSPNLEENLTEEDLFEFLRNAAQAGIFDNFGGTTSGEGTHSSGSKSGVNGVNNSKRKKKGKKQW
ncbi:hypothetical protein Dimus_000734 [Dionaea muscipula]